MAVWFLLQRGLPETRSYRLSTGVTFGGARRSILLQPYNNCSRLMAAFKSRSILWPQCSQPYNRSARLTAFSFPPCKQRLVDGKNRSANKTSQPYHRPGLERLLELRIIAYLFLGSAEGTIISCFGFEWSRCFRFGCCFGMNSIYCPLPDPDNGEKTEEDEKKELVCIHPVIQREGCY
jgi:hypothetical protein